MARLTILIPLLAALLLVVHASASRWEQDSCKKQLERVNLKHCEKHIWQRIQQKQEEEEGEEEEDVLKLRGINYLRRRESGQKQRQQQQEQQEQELMQCCDQLSELNNPKCQCRALQQIMENQSEYLQGKRQKQLMEQELKKLPKMCELGPVRGCDLSCEED